MDPITALIVGSMFAALAAKFTGRTIQDTAASIRGKTPPTMEKWRRRQDARAARGLAREAKPPGLWRTRWRFGVEEHIAKLALKHRARMEHLDEIAPEVVEKHKDRLRRRAARRDTVGALVAKWGNASWEGAKQSAAAKKTAVAQELPDTTAAPPADSPDNVVPFPQRSAESPSEKEAAEQRQQGAESGAGTVPPTHPLAQPRCAYFVAGNRCIRRAEPGLQVCEQHRDTTSGTDLDDTTTEGNSTVNNTTTTTEITDLETAISHGQESATYTDKVVAALADITAQVDAAMQGLTAEAASQEQAKASLSGEGFGDKITGRYDTAGEALNLAAAALKAALESLTTASEQTSTAGGEMRGAVQTFSDQLAVSETVGAAKQDSGVSKRTDFYAPA